MADQRKSEKARGEYEKSLNKWEEKLNEKTITPLGELPTLKLDEPFDKSLQGKRIIMEPLEYHTSSNAYTL